MFLIVFLISPFSPQVSFDVFNFSFQARAFVFQMFMRQQFATTFFRSTPVLHIPFSPRPLAGTKNLVLPFPFFVLAFMSAHFWKARALVRSLVLCFLRSPSTAIVVRGFRSLPWGCGQLYTHVLLRPPQLNPRNTPCLRSVAVVSVTRPFKLPSRSFPL